MEETRVSPGFRVIGGYDRKVASNHQDWSVPSLSLESKPLLPFAVGRFRTDPFKYGEDVVGGGSMAVIVTGPTT